MTSSPAPLASALLLLALAGCGDSTPADNGTDVPLVVASTAPAAPIETGTVSDPASSSCGTTLAANFVGETDTLANRDALTAAVGTAAPGGIRFRTAGMAVTDDLRPDRLNVMIDTTGVIRDLRCE